MKDRTRRERSRWTIAKWLERASRAVIQWTGSSWAFGLSVMLILGWLVTGPIFHFSDTWQLVINTGTTIITFLMVFLIQRAQNKDALAIQLKLNEIVAAISGASNRLIDVENLTEAELQRLHDFYHRLATMAKRDVDLRQSHSIEEAEVRHRRKRSTSGAPASAPTPQTEPDTSG